MATNHTMNGKLQTAACLMAVHSLGVTYRLRQGYIKLSIVQIDKCPDQILYWYKSE